MREIKSVSSRWVHEEIGLQQFQWQEGYGAFTVGASQRKAVREYIQGQEGHHRMRTFQEEYLEFLSRGEVGAGGLRTPANLHSTFGASRPLTVGRF